MSAYQITVSVTPLCSCCGAELQIGCTESKPAYHPLERDNPYERTARRVFFLPCEKCFVFRPRVAELVEAAKLAAKINPFGSVENADARDAAIAALAKFGAAK